MQQIYIWNLLESPFAEMPNFLDLKTNIFGYSSNKSQALSEWMEKHLETNVTILG